MRWIVRYVAGGLMGLALAFGVLSCQVNPVTGQQQFNILSPGQEVRLGEEAAPQFLEEFGGEIPSESIRAYVRDIGEPMAAASERPDLPWEFYVTDSAVLNAFALPGGKVFITRGMLEEMENEAQLAAILGHEIGHVTMKHIGQRMSQAMAVQFGLIGVGVAAQASDDDWLRVLGIGAEVGAGLTLLSYSRRHETEADEEGLRYMADQGYNPVGMMQLMEMLASQPGGRPPELLSTHPLPDTRVRQVEQWIVERYPDYDDPAAYTFGYERYEREVLAVLEELDEPAHDPEREDE